MRWFRRRRCWNCDYDFDRLQLVPAHLLLSGHLMSAKTFEADALIYGIPAELPDNVREEALQRALHDSVEEARQLFPNAFSRYGTPEIQAAEDASVRLQSSVGWKNIPCIYRYGREFSSTVGVLVNCFIDLFMAVNDRLVCLNSSLKNPQPVKYIEFRELHATPNERHFAEVELWLDSNNSLRIEIKGFRVEPKSVRVSRYISGY